MEQSVKAFQEKLEHKFSILKENRKISNGDRVFAIEHELTEDEIKSLFHLVNQCLGKIDIERYWLLLVVVATEIGYSFKGDEYWQTFEKKIPNWEKSGKKQRVELRKCFEKFRDQYHGITPSGKWAKNFTVISWPVTNSVLPLDIQRHFIESLYKLRFSLKDEHFENKELLASEIKSQSINLTSRFKNFLSNSSLVWQFVSALKAKAQNSGETKLSETAFERIVKDLEKRESSRIQLKDISDKIHRFSRKRQTETTEKTKNVICTPNLKLQLYLKPSIENKLMYKLYVRTLNLSRYFSCFQELKSEFLKYDFYIRGKPDYPQRSKNLLSPRGFKLNEWPNKDILLFNPIDCDNTKVEDLYKKIAVNVNKDFHLFKLQKNGIGQHIIHGHLRANSQYILISKSIESMKDKGTEVLLDFAGIQGIKFEVDSQGRIPFNDSELASLGLCNVSFFDVWPSGISPSQWDEDDSIEWLTTDIPILAIRASDKVEGVDVKLQRKKLFISLKENKIKFVQLPSLPSGVYSMIFSSQSKISNLNNVESKINMLIREPQISDSRVSLCNPLIIDFSPIHPSYEDLMDSKIKLFISGPYGLKVTTKAIFYEKNRKAKSFFSEEFSFELPIDSYKWNCLFKNHIIKEANYKKLTESYSCKLIFDCEESGDKSIVFEREESALRWSFEKSKKKTYLKLIDDTDSMEEPNVLYYPLKTPDSLRELDYKQVIDGFEIKESGLFLAEIESSRCVEFIKKSQRKLLNSFKQLSSKQPIKLKIYDIGQLNEIIDLLKLWHSSTQGGILDEQGKLHVISELTKAFFSTIGGDTWRSIEVKKKINLKKMFEELIKPEWRCRGIAVSIKKTFKEDLLNKHPSCIDFWLAGKFKSFKLIPKMTFEDLLSLSKICLQLASSSKEACNNKRIKEFLDIFIQRPAIPLLARYLFLSVRKLKEHESDFMEHFRRD